MSRIGELQVAIVADTSQVASGIERGVSGAMSGVQRETSRSMADVVGNIQGGFQRAGDQAVRTGKTLSKNVTAPILGIATAALTVGMRFQDQMARVQAISGATGEDLSALTETAQHLGSTTRFSANEAAEGMEFLALAGFETSEIIGAMPGLLDLASAGAMDLGRAADIVSDTMSAFGMSADEATQAADIFATQSSISNTSVEQLGEAMTKAAPAAAALGVDLETTSAALGVMADQGIKGGRAGTAFQAVLRDLTAAAEDGGIAIGDMTIEVFNAEGEFRNFEDIIRDITTATEGMSDQQRNAALSSIFQQQGLQGILPLLGENTDALEEYIDANRDAEGAASSMAAIMEDTLGGSVRELKSQFEGLLIQMSQELAPIIRDEVVPAVQRGGEIVSEWVERFAELDEGTRRTIFAVLGIVAALGPVLIAVGTFLKMIASVLGVVKGVITAFGAVKGALAVVGAAFGIAAAKVLLIVAAVGAVIAGFVALWRRSERLQEVVSSVWDAITSAVRTAADFITETVWPALQTAFETARGWFESLRETATSVWDTITDATAVFLDWWEEHVTPTVEAVSEAFSAAFTLLGEVAGVAFAVVRGEWEDEGSPTLTAISSGFGRLRDTLQTVWGVIQVAWQVLMTAIRAVWNRIGPPLIRTIERGWEQLRDTTRTVWNVIRTIIETVLGVIRGIAETFIALVSGDWEGFHEGLRNTAETIWNGISDIISEVTGFVSRTIDRFLSTVQDWWSTAWDTVTTVLRTAWETIQRVVEERVADLVSFVTELPGKLRDALSGAASALRSRGEEFIRGLRAGVVNRWQNLRTWFTGLGGRVRSAIGQLGSLLIGTGRAIIGGLASGIRARFNELLGELRGYAARIRNAKGPMSADRVLLTDQGRAIMDGLGDGMRAGFAAVEDELGKQTEAIGGVFGAAAQGVSGADVRAPWRRVTETTMQSTDALLVHVRDYLGGITGLWDSSYRLLKQISDATLGAVVEGHVTAYRRIVEVTAEAFEPLRDEWARGRDDAEAGAEGLRDAAVDALSSLPDDFAQIARDAIKAMQRELDSARLRPPAIDVPDVPGVPRPPGVGAPGPGEQTARERIGKLLRESAERRRAERADHPRFDPELGRVISPGLREVLDRRRESSVTVNVTGSAQPVSEERLTTLIRRAQTLEGIR